jgi:hypothetical protein
MVLLMNRAMRHFVFFVVFQLSFVAALTEPHQSFSSDIFLALAILDMYSF